MYNFFDKILTKLGNENKDVFFISIGAMDGIKYDDSYGYRIKYKFNTLYVEPVPYLFDKLKNNFLNENAIFENSAISTYDGLVQMLTIDKLAIDNNMVNECFYGMSAIYPPKNGLKSTEDMEVVEKYGELITVPCITLSTLLNKHSINKIDVMCIDAEGWDYEIIKQLDLKKYQPSLMRAEYINLTDIEKKQIVSFFLDNSYTYEIHGQNIDAIPTILYTSMFKENKVEENKVEENIPVKLKNTTIVTGLWDLKRDKLSDGWSRTFEHYIYNFIKLLRTDLPMFIYIEAEYEHIVWEHRKKENTFVKIRETDEFKTWFSHYDRVQEIRKDSFWYNKADWLKDSTQAKLEMYNPIVMSKMFMLNDARISNVFNSEYFIWMDAAITNTVHEGYFTEYKLLEKFTEYMNDKFTFICFPYDGKKEIHGFDYKAICNYAGEEVNYVARGGIFGGPINTIYEANALYYDVLTRTLSDGHMGTEESIFTIMTYAEQDAFNKHFIKNDGLISTFFEEMKNNKNKIYNKDKLDINNTSLYIITFNAPEQLKYTLESFKEVDKNFIDKPARKILLNNSTDHSTDAMYDELCLEYNFEQIKKDNIGICGGRQFIAEHFIESEQDYMFFFEDDMTLMKKNSIVKCRNGFNTYSDNLYKTSLEIIQKEGFDFLKLSYSEFYGDNGMQWAWYNIPQEVREKWFPNHKNLSQYSVKLKVPKTKMEQIASYNNIPYVSGEIYYSNWPQILTKNGTQKLFIDTKFAHPFEQTWMSHIFSLHKLNKITAGVLLLSPIHHRRVIHYDGDDRREN